MEEKRDTGHRGGIRMLRLQDEEYPERLREIPHPPKELYVLGEIPKEQTPTVAIIGARDCSEYGSYVASVLGAAMGHSGVQVVSGMARGIDGIGQEAALDAGGSAYAVLGCGVDICYPAKNRPLYEKLQTGGGILSEYPPGTPPLPGYFPARNRIVSGLADAVVVVEAREKSGTLITVDMALEQGREVYVVPGRVTDPLSKGCNRLMKLGAGILLNTEDFAEELRGICARRFSAVGDLGTGSREQKTGSGRQERTQGTAKMPEGGQNEKKIGRMQDAAGGKEDLSEKKAAAALTGEQRSLLEENPELSAVYGALDITPDSVEQIRERLPKRYREGQINVHLIRLCMEGLAMQVSPGHFCVKPIAPCAF